MTKLDIVLRLLTEKIITTEEAAILLDNLQERKQHFTIHLMPATIYPVTYTGTITTTNNTEF